MTATRYNNDVDEVTLPLSADFRATVPAFAPAPLLEQFGALREENAALRTQNTALEAQVTGLQTEVQGLRARLGQDSSNSSRPPWSDPSQAPQGPNAPPTGRIRGGQLGHHGSFRSLLPVPQGAKRIEVAQAQHKGWGCIS